MRCAPYVIGFFVELGRFSGGELKTLLPLLFQRFRLCDCHQRRSCPVQFCSSPAVVEQGLSWRRGNLNGPKLQGVMDHADFVIGRAKCALDADSIPPRCHQIACPIYQAGCQCHRLDCCGSGWSLREVSRLDPSRLTDLRQASDVRRRCRIALCSFLPGQSLPSNPTAHANMNWVLKSKALERSGLVGEKGRNHHPCARTGIFYPLSKQAGRPAAIWLSGGRNRSKPASIPPRASKIPFGSMFRYRLEWDTDFGADSGWMEGAPMPAGRLSGNK